MFKNSKLGKLLDVTGLKPIADVVAGPNGVISMLKETNDPNSKISSRKSAASVMIFTAVAMVPTMNYEVVGQVVTFCMLVFTGSALLGMASFNRNKPSKPE